MTLQKCINLLRKIFPRGWSPILKILVKLIPSLKIYPAKLENGNILYIDLSQTMCHGYFYNGKISHEEYSDALFKKVLKKGMKFIDIGANIGYFSRLAVDLVGEEGHIISFEPNPIATKILNINMQFFQNFKIYNCALSDKVGKSKFYVHKNADRSSLIQSDNTKEIIVDTVTLDSLLNEEEKVDFIKIDVEGYELNVLRGAVNTIVQSKPIIYFEFIEGHLEKQKLTYTDFEIFFNAINYKMDYINEDDFNNNLLSNNKASYIVAYDKNKKLFD
jgi:FkbM family methyltransferase